MTTMSCVKPNTGKRQRKTSLVCPKAKRQRMDKQLCIKALEELMKHPCAWIFKVPVDPLKWNAGYYFSVIRKPMDLGTVKRKLEGDLYSSVDEFAADVRLTFSNAMSYNSPEDDVYKLAKFLLGSFNQTCKSIVEEKLSGDHEEYLWKSSTAQSSVDNKKDGINMSNKSMSSLEGRRQKVRMSFEEKSKLRSEVMEVLSGMMTDKLRVVLRKLGMGDLQEKKLRSYIDAADDEILWKLKNAIQNSIDAKAGKVQDSSTFDSKLGPDSDGRNTVVTSSSNMLTSSDIQLSPKMASRAAMLKRRFASTIYKASLEVEKSDSTTMQQEREKSLERKQAEEKARRIEKAELNRLREKERAAARMALEKMERTVFFDDAREICREFENLLGCSPYGTAF